MLMQSTKCSLMGAKIIFQQKLLGEIVFNNRSTATCRPTHPTVSNNFLLPFAVTCPQLSASVHIQNPIRLNFDADDLQLIWIFPISWLYPYLHGLQPARLEIAKFGVGVHLNRVGAIVRPETQNSIFNFKGCLLFKTRSRLQPKAAIFVVWRPTNAVNSAVGLVSQRHFWEHGTPRQFADWSQRRHPTNRRWVLHSGMQIRWCWDCAKFFCHIFWKSQFWSKTRNSLSVILKCGIMIKSPVKKLERCTVKI